MGLPSGRCLVKVVILWDEGVFEVSTRRRTVRLALTGTFLSCQRVLDCMTVVPDFKLELAIATTGIDKLSKRKGQEYVFISAIRANK